MSKLANTMDSPDNARGSDGPGFDSSGFDILTLRLPSSGKGPLASPGLIMDDESTYEKADTLKPWFMDTIGMEPDTALDFLVSLPARPSRGNRYGTTLRFWMEAAKFAIELISRQRFVPTLQVHNENGHDHDDIPDSGVYGDGDPEKFGGSYMAEWNVVITEEDYEKLRLLSRGMPPCCRAILPGVVDFEGNGGEGMSGNESVVTNFLNSTANSFVRNSLLKRNISLLKRVEKDKTKRKKNLKKTGKGKSERKQELTVPEMWLQALSGEEPMFEISAKKAEQFSRKLNTWLVRILPVDMDAPFRTCFRLEPPEPVSAEIGDENGDSERNIEKEMKITMNPNGTVKRKRGRPPKVRDEDSPGKVEVEERPPGSKSCETIDQVAVEWNVTFHLQARDDKSLLVPADVIWNSHGHAPNFLKRKFEKPQERLLGDLGRASTIFPMIDESLQSSCPVAVSLNTSQAYSFLRESAPLLEQNGFGVLLPAWWEKPAVRVGVKLNVKSKEKIPKIGSGHFGLKSILEYSWEVALGDETFSPREFEELSRLKVPLVRVKGQWVELRKEDVEKAITFFSKKHGRRGKGEMEMGQALRLAMGREDAEAGLPVVDIEAKGWVGDVFRRLSGGIRIGSLHTPGGFNGKLRPYQLRGYSWMDFMKRFGFGACLADDMGLGKTIQFITLMLRERSRSSRTRQNPTLIICPMSVVGNWKKEIECFAPSLDVMVHHGQNRLSGEDFLDEVRKNDVVLSTYALALRDQVEFSSVNWQCISLDEAQKIKNPAAKQTRAIKKLEADYRVALTGTPVENRLSELWSIMDFLNPGYLGSVKEFHKSFALPIEKYRNKEKSETLRDLIRPFVLRRLKSDPKIIKDLPEKMEMKVFCNLSKEQASLYEAFVNERMDKIENSSGIQRKGLVLSSLVGLKQICNHPALFVKDGSSLPDRSGKLARLTEMLEEVLAEGDKALIFTQFAEMGVMLRHYLRETLGCETLFLHGGTTKKQRDAMISRFQAGQDGQGEQGIRLDQAGQDGYGGHDGPPLFVLSLKAGGLGLNLTAANHVFHFDRWWNPAVENQATDRAFRIGQKKNVQVHKFVCAGTLEERIDAMIDQKKELAESIVGAGEGWITELSTDRLREIFSLNREEMGGV